MSIIIGKKLPQTNKANFNWRVTFRLNATVLAWHKNLRCLNKAINRNCPSKETKLVTKLSGDLNK
jgi:hypothetical protein